VQVAVGYTIQIKSFLNSICKGSGSQYRPQVKSIDEREE
jgi:hypothetical protein